MRFIDNCPFCFPTQPVYLQGDNWRVIVHEEANHYLLVPKEHLPSTAASLAKSADMFEAIEGMGWPMEIVVHLNGYQGWSGHLCVHLYRRG